MKNLGLLIAIVVLTSCGQGARYTSTAQATTEDWLSAYENTLNGTFVGSESGIVSFKIDTSLIYVEVDNSVPANEYGPMARAWALNFSEEKQKHSGSNVTAYITKGGKIFATVNYGKSKGFH